MRLQYGLLVWCCLEGIRVFGDSLAVAGPAYLNANFEAEMCSRAAFHQGLAGYGIGNVVADPSQVSAMVPDGEGSFDHVVELAGRGLLVAVDVLVGSEADDMAPAVDFASHQVVGLSGEHL
ncbi:hypothetical protein MRB53_039182 [Persea americana]|nr:hypothetical protein MRB53_039182 [Persea americana]